MVKYFCDECKKEIEDIDNMLDFKQDLLISSPSGRVTFRLQLPRDNKKKHLEQPCICKNCLEKALSSIKWDNSVGEQ